jgi:hypothetical protein
LNKQIAVAQSRKHQKSPAKTGDFILASKIIGAACLPQYNAYE